MSECQSVRGQWGEICPDCGRRLPEALPWGYGRPCSRRLEFPSGSSAGLGERHWSKGPVLPGQRPKVIPRTPVGGWDTQL